MVRCNLSVLLAERNLKITRVCKDTGLSRTTLTYLANNYSKGIQYDTLNKLCAYLQVLPGELISFVPVDISHLNVLRTGDKNEQLEIELEITHRGVTKNASSVEMRICIFLMLKFLTLSESAVFIFRMRWKLMWIYLILMEIPNARKKMSL